MSPAKSGCSPSRPLLPAAESSRQCDLLLTELTQVGSADDLALWAHRILPLKNTLLAGDAHRLELAFTAKTADVAADDSEAPREMPAPREASENPTADAAPKVVSRTERRRGGKLGAQTPRIDKSILAFPEPRRIRDKEHLKYVGTQACLICGRTPSDAHHVRFAQLRALGRKVSDEFTVPVCRTHHRELHRWGDEQAWWQRTGLDPLKVAANLWRTSHPIRAASSP